MDTLPDQSIYARDLHQLAENGAEAQAAFDRLWGAVRETTLRQLARYGVVGDDADDVLQDVCARLWRLRESVRAKSLGEWVALVRTTTSRVANTRKRPEERVEVDEIPVADLPYLDVITEASVRRRIYETADRLWLGEPDADADLGAAALRLVLAEGLGRDDVASMFGVDSETFDRWLESPAILARALYADLCWPSDELAGYVLCADEPLTPRELDAIAADPTESERRIVLWRIRNGLLVERIVRLSGGSLGVETVEDILRRARATYPFRRLAEGLRSSLDVEGRSDALTKPGLWKRIAFEYHTRYDLPHKQILERALPAAEVVRYKLSETTLNNWFGLGRLWSALAAALQEEGR